MNLLFLALEPPYPPNDGGRIRTFNILKEVARQHKITLVTFADPVRDGERLEPLREFCSEVLAVHRPTPPQRNLIDKLRDLRARYPVALAEYASIEMQAALKRLADSGRFEVAHVDQIYLAQYADDLAPLPAVLTHHNVEAIGQRRALQSRCDRYSPRWWAAWLEYRRWRRFELATSRRFDALAVVSPQEAVYFKTHVTDVSIFIVPNGVDTSYFQPMHQPTNETTLLYTGRMDYLPNVDAMLWFCQEILPLIRGKQPQATLTIVGRDPVPEVQALANLPGVIVTGTVTDVRPYFTQAAVYITPLRLGAGTRLKVLEAMAMGIPVVSTRLGCEGLEVSSGEDIVIADEAECFAAEVVRLLGDTTAQTVLSGRARQTVEQRYDWAAIAREQERAYELVISR